eukprot:scaffold12992_cov58-Phaeocystis_antarctica.AAC.4
MLIFLPSLGRICVLTSRLAARTSHAFGALFVAKFLLIYTPRSGVRSTLCLGLGLGLGLGFGLASPDPDPNPNPNQVCALLRADGQPLLLPVQQVARRRAGAQRGLPAVHAPGGIQR